MAPFHASFHREPQSGSISLYSIHVPIPFIYYPFGVIEIRDVVSSLSVSISIYGKFKFYIWKVQKSSYNNPEIEIEKKKGRFVMIFQSFILGNLVSLCMKIINSVVVVGLYYGFLNTFSIGPS